LSPAYDLNPVPVDVRPRVLSVAITIDDPTASLTLAMEAAEYFEMSLPSKATRQFSPSPGESTRHRSIADEARAG
jgi:hypothetical protein